MSLKPFANLRQIAFALRRNYRKRFVYIAYGLAPGARYKEFTIPKKSGGTRRICAPRIALLGLQRDILRLLESDYRPRAHVHGFVGGHQRSIVSNARQHVGKRWVLNIDLEDYFETIHFGRIRGRLMAPPYDYPEEIAQFIAHIACFQTEKEVEGSLRTTHVLMPGAALSPILANIVSDKLDAELARFCRQLGCTYTRYADDITISSNRRTFPAPIGRFANPDSHDDFILSDTFQQMIEDNGFRINHAKTRLLGAAFQQEVTGLVVNEKVNVKRKFVRDVRAMLHDWEFNGYAAASARHFNDKRPDRGRLPEQEATNFEWVLRGKIEFIRQVKGSTDQVFRGLAARFNALSSGGQFSIPLVEDSEVLNAAVWYLENDTDGGSVGTCFAVAENLFATCAHCLGPNLRIFPRQSPAFAMEADEVARDEHNDLALIRLRTPMPAFNPAATLQMASRAEAGALGIRSAVQAAGYPSNLDSTSLTIRDTEVTGFSRQTFDGTPATSDNVIALLSGTYEGMSGGPVLFSGKVVGVIVRGPNDDDRTIPFLAVRSEFVDALLATL
ncbi:reverse transcriptase domain-containing protein [Paracoccus seriniphilus]|uniref:RNA-directed DNA polymerase n=1 Tax=Paracoccus seriniphilus TaxID=184748 RepID=A0A239Q0A1_9RHOB|nr:reverse transcriptase domain-containing protein [Paracoccus seriniphilus]MBR9852821.1 trypsin-like serine protease [Paracoccaceae bacterium]WCR14002.1 trypsin-like peptidase domain-containing protein [Paracoccus seriniphilus]SNT76039.1 Trypsin-like peptidase domain-containing protein [Paracoccus seriniphilus]